MTTKKFIAVSVKGQEFLFDKSRTIAVPDTSAQKICALCTKSSVTQARE